MNSKFALTSLALLVSAGVLVGCGEKEAAPAVVEEVAVVEPVEAEIVEKPYITSSFASTVNATVKSLNLETREVVLLAEDGSELDFVVSEDARNLDQVEIGDTVVSEYETTITFEVVAGEDIPKLGAVEGGAIVRSEEGEKPGLAIVDESIEAFKVSDINIEAGTFKLTNAEGIEKEYVAEDPENLKRTEVGDVLLVSVSESVAIDVVESDWKLGADE
ncbi:hypothetical protein [Agaribacterium sp. ZY112]|uniref:hypothetical protein n=1 Tax=Agaribacterium sp. ZY112 TaxID=3233574 RepID=UPI003524E8D6